MTTKTATSVSAVLGAALVAVVLAGCSGTGQLSGSDAAKLATEVGEVSHELDTHQCGTAQAESLPRIEREVASLPDSVATDLRQALADSVGHLNDLVAQQCHPPALPNLAQNEGTSVVTPANTAATTQLNTPKVRVFGLDRPARTLTQPPPAQNQNRPRALEPANAVTANPQDGDGKDHAGSSQH